MLPANEFGREAKKVPGLPKTISAFTLFSSFVLFNSAIFLSIVFVSSSALFGYQIFFRTIELYIRRKGY